MNYQPLSQHDLQQTFGGASLPITVPGCILYVPGHPKDGATTDPVYPDLSILVTA